MMIMVLSDKNSEDICKKDWLLDSGCTHNMCGDIGSFKVLNKCYKSKIKIGNRGYVSVEGKGVVFINTPEGSKQVSNVLFVPPLSQNLISVG